jgi:hypothetical protein
MYAKAFYRTIISMTPFYLENVFRWVKMAVWDAPMRVYLDVDLEKQVIEKEIFMEIQRLSRVGPREYSG